MTLTAYAKVNLSAVRHNIKKVREYAPESKIMAVIKANAYGHGLLRIAEVLGEVDALAVARVNEAMELRQAGYNNRVVILDGFFCEQELNELLQYNLDTVVHSIEQVKILEKYSGQSKVSVWLKIDTGMNRLGIEAVESAPVYKRLSNCTGINHPISLMSHYYHADEKSSDATLRQSELFNNMVHMYPGDKSIANSAGIIAWPDTINNWVRPGIMLYGVSPFSGQIGEDLGLTPVMSLHSKLISVKTIKPGARVGYAGTWYCETSTRLGIVAIGYGDGYPRAAKTGTPVLINGKRVPLVGRVSMDMIAVDLCTQPGSKPGDTVTLWGDGLPVEEIAQCSDTIPYTLLCGVTQRVKTQSVYL